MTNPLPGSSHSAAVAEGDSDLSVILGTELTRLHRVDTEDDSHGRARALSNYITPSRQRKSHTSQKRNVSNEQKKVVFAMAPRGILNYNSIPSA